MYLQEEAEAEAEEGAEAEAEAEAEAAEEAEAEVMEEAEAEVMGGDGSGSGDAGLGPRARGPEDREIHRVRAFSRQPSAVSRGVWGCGGCKQRTR